MEFGILLSTHVYFNQCESYLTVESFDRPVTHEEGIRGGSS